MSTWMSKSAQNYCHLQAETLCTASWRLLLLRRCMCPVLPHWYLPPLSWSNQWTWAWPFKLRFWPTPTGKSCIDCNQAKRTPTVTKWFFLLWASSGWFTSIEQLRHLVARQCLDRWQMNCFQPDRVITVLFPSLNYASISLGYYGTQETSYL